MDELEKFPFFHDEGIRLVSSCPLCDAKLSAAKAQMIEEREDMSLVHIQCSKCKTSLLVVVVNTQMGISSVVLITDLSFEDVLTFRDIPELTADTVIEIHQMMKDKNVVKKILALK